MGVDYYLINKYDKEYIYLDKSGYTPSDVVVDVLNMVSKGYYMELEVNSDDEFYQVKEEYSLQEFKADEYRDFRLVKIEDISEEFEQITIVRNKLRQYYRTPEWYDKEI